MTDDEIAQQRRDRTREYIHQHLMANAEKVKEWQRTYRLANHEKVAEKQRECIPVTQDQMDVWHRIYFQSEAGKASERRRLGCIASYEKAAEQQRQYRKQLADGYVRGILAKGLKVGSSAIPDSLVGVYREIIKIRRFVNEKRA